MLPEFARRMKNINTARWKRHWPIKTDIMDVLLNSGEPNSGVNSEEIHTGPRFTLSVEGNVGSGKKIHY